MLHADSARELALDQSFNHPFGISRKLRGMLTDDDVDVATVFQYGANVAQSIKHDKKSRTMRLFFMNRTTSCGHSHRQKKKITA